MNNNKKYFWNKAILKKLKYRQDYRKIAQYLRNTDMKWLIEDYKIVMHEIGKIWKRELYYANLKRLNSGIYSRSFAKKIDTVRMIKGKTAAFTLTEEDFAGVAKSLEAIMTSDIHQDKKFLANKIKRLLRMKMKKVYGKDKYRIPSFEDLRKIVMNIPNISKGGGKILGGKYRLIGIQTCPNGANVQIWERIRDKEREIIGPSDGDNLSDEAIFTILEDKFANRDAIKKLIKNE